MLTLAVKVFVAKRVCPPPKKKDLFFFINYKVKKMQVFSLYIVNPLELNGNTFLCMMIFCGWKI